MRLHLLVLLDLRSSPTVLPSLLSHPVETGRAHQKYIATYVFASDNSDRQYTFGGPGGNRTPVQDAFALKELQQLLALT